MRNNAVLWRAVSLTSFDHRLSHVRTNPAKPKDQIWWKPETRNAKFCWVVFFSENAKLQSHWWFKLLVVKVGLRYRTGYCRLCWILSEVQQPTSLRIHKSGWILGRYPPVILNVTRITAIPRLILIDPLSLTMPCLQVKDIIILLRVSAEQWPLFKWKTRLITTQVSQLWQLDHVRVHNTLPNWDS